MAAYPSFVASDLSSFSGREVSTYSGYAATALAQAVLLFKISTCLKEWPDDSTKAEFARMSVLSMADAIYLVQPFQQVKANPFSSESIGSYSYSKLASAVTNGLPTGITWFDLGVAKLGVCDIVENVATGGGIEVFEYDGDFVQGHNKNVRLLSPQDIDAARSWGFDPAPGYVSSGTIGDGEYNWVEDPDYPGIYYLED